MSDSGIARSTQSYSRARLYLKSLLSSCLVLTIQGEVLIHSLSLNRSYQLKSRDLLYCQSRRLIKIKCI